MTKPLSIHQIHHTYDQHAILQGVDLTVNAGEIVCLLGASGSGKTTLLRIIAGLAQADSGDIRLAGQSILHIPVHQRDFGLMFQDFALFPHLNVAQNIAFGMRMRHLPAKAQQARVTQMLALVGLSGFEARNIAQLSGGEKQRIALARSLAPNPQLLLLDEPLGSLDATLRERLVVDLRNMIKQAAVTAIYVTHDQQEAFAIADRIAIMHNGKIEQLDTPQQLYRQPKTSFVAQFLGLNNLLPVIADRDGYALTPIGAVRMREGVQAVLLHPQGITLSNTAQAHDAIMTSTGSLTEAVFLGDRYRLTLQHQSGSTITFYHHADDAIPAIGDQLTIDINASAIIPLTS